MEDVAQEARGAGPTGTSPGPPESSEQNRCRWGSERQRQWAPSAQGGEECCQAPREPGARRETCGSQPSRTPRPHLGRGQAVERMPEDRTLPERLSDPSETVGTRGDPNTLNYKGILSGNREP